MDKVQEVGQTSIIAQSSRARTKFKNLDAKCADGHTKFTMSHKLQKVIQSSKGYTKFKRSYTVQNVIQSAQGHKKCAISYEVQKVTQS